MLRWTYYTLHTARVQARSRREGGELDSHEEVRLSCADPDEINRRAVSCRLLRLSFIEGPGSEIDQLETEEGRIGAAAGPLSLESPEETDQGGREAVELGSESWTCLLLHCSSAAVSRTLM